MGCRTQGTTFEINPPQEELLVTYRRAVADAAHKHSLIQTVARKGPKAIEAAVDAAAKAAKRRNSYAAKLQELGVDVALLEASA